MCSQILDCLPEDLFDCAFKKWCPLQGFVRIPTSLCPRHPHLLPNALLHLRVASQLKQSKLQGYCCLKRG